MPIKRYSIEQINNLRSGYRDLIDINKTYFALINEETEKLTEAIKVADLIAKVEELEKLIKSPKVKSGKNK